MLRRIVGVIVLLAVVSGCVLTDDDVEPEASTGDHPPIEPQFAPEPSAGAGGSRNSADSASPTADGGGAGGSSTTAGSGATASSGAATPPVPATAGTLEDRTGDVTVAPLDPAPKYADLVAATLRRAAGGFTLRVRFNAPAPASGTGDDHTMNVATFFDVDGDGSVDYEVWANVARDGWGGAWFDNANDRGGYLDDSDVRITVDRGVLVLRFPLGHVGNAARFRWAMATEYGRLETLGTIAAARDAMPDNDGAARFPG